MEYDIITKTADTEPYELTNYDARIVEEEKR